jgi:ABC-2 type transport system ATP-binding protein
MRGLLRHLAGEGRTILISSHLLSEVQQTVDDVVIIAHGKLVQASSLDELAVVNVNRTVVQAADPAALMALAERNQWSLRPREQQPDAAEVTGPSAEEIGHACFAAGVELHQLATQHDGLEGSFLALTEGQGSMR